VTGKAPVVTEVVLFVYLYYLADLLNFAHGGLHVEGLHIVPVLLEEGDEEVDGHNGVLSELIRSHTDMTNSDTHAEDLLELEFDLGLDVVDLLLNVVIVTEGGGEFTGLVETRPKESGDLRDQSLRSDEGIKLAGELLDGLRVLVELLEILNRFERETELLGDLAMSGITKNADLHSGSRDVRKLDGTSETLISLGVVVLQADLELHSLHEVSLLLSSTIENGLDGFLQVVDVKLASHI
jgi:hypothetical protein